jgi:hypothetical protein
MRHSFLGAALAAALLAGAGALEAQSAKRPAQNNAPRPVELGVDMDIGFGLDDPSTTTISLPNSVLRAGFFINERVSIEPQFSFQHISVSGGGSSTGLGLQVGALYHFSPDRARNQWYLRPMVGLAHASFGGGSATQAALGVGFGVKLPIMDRVATRLEGKLGHAFETSSAPGATSLGLVAGLSFFTR